MDSTRIWINTITRVILHETRFKAQIYLATGSEKISCSHISVTESNTWFTGISNAMVYQYQWDVTAGDTDYSGRIYTPAAVDCMCRAIERLMIDVDLSVPDTLANRDFQLPVVHTEVDYLAELSAGETVNTETNVTIGDTSLEFKVVGYHSDDPAFEGHTRMVLVDETQDDTVSVPDWMRERLAPHIDNPTK